MAATEDDLEAEGLNLVRARQLATEGGGQAIREKAGLSRAELARMVPCSEVTVWRYEHRKRRPAGPFAARYLEVLASVAKVLEGIDR